MSPFLSRAMPVAFVALLAIAAIPVVAQEPAPHGIGPYETHYVVYGRIVDGRGIPVNGLLYNVAIKDTFDNTENKGSVTGQTRGRGELQADFRMGQVTQYGTVTLTVGDRQFTQTLDPETRRTDFAVVLEDRMQSNTPPHRWDGSYSVRVRVVNLTDPYPAPEWGHLYAKPMPAVTVDAILVDQAGRGTMYPRTAATHAHGDWNYTFITPDNITGGYLLLTVKDQTFNITLTEELMKTRYTYQAVKFGESRLPTTYDKPTPSPAWTTPVALALAALLGVLWYVRDRRQDGKPREPRSPPGPP